MIIHLTFQKLLKIQLVAFYFTSYTPLLLLSLFNLQKLNKYNKYGTRAKT